MPMPLIKLAPSNELVMIELQGSLDIDDPDAEGGQALAEIEFHPGREDKPTLLISHHRLEGKLVTLTKPFVVLERKKRADNPITKGKDSDRRGGQEHAERFSGSASSPSTSAIVDKEEEPGSPSLNRKRAAGNLLEACRERGKAAVAEASSSPVPTSRTLPGSEADFSSPLAANKRMRLSTSAEEQASDDQDVHADLMDKDDTATYMEVVCIIRKKFLFSKRPEPIVRLDQAGGEKAKQALGLAS
jgi:hypothetical protein